MSYSSWDAVVCPEYPLLNPPHILRTPQLGELHQTKQIWPTIVQEEWIPHLSSICPIKQDMDLSRTQNQKFPGSCPWQLWTESDSQSRTKQHCQSQCKMPQVQLTFVNIHGLERKQKLKWVSPKRMPTHLSPKSETICYPTPCPHFQDRLVDPDAAMEPWGTYITHGGSTPGWAAAKTGSPSIWCLGLPLTSSSTFGFSK